MLSLATSAATANPINATFPLEGSLLDTDGNYGLTEFGDPTSFVARGGGFAIDLAGRSWLEVPNAIHSGLQLDESLSLSVDFYFKDTGVDESVRVILSNKDWAYDRPGLKIEVFNEKIEWQPDGIIFVQFNIGVGTREIATRFFDLPMDQWHTATVDIDVERGEVTFGVNGRRVVKSLTEAEGGETVDPSGFLASLTDTIFRLGTHQSDPGVEPEWRNEFDIANGSNTTTSNLAEVYIDNFVIQSPKPAGDAAVVNAILRSYTDHLSGTQTLSATEQTDQLTLLRDNINGVDFAAIAVEAAAFINAHAGAYGPIYQIVARNNVDNVRYDDLQALSKAYVDLGVWMLESGLASSDVSTAAGITFIEHAEWPGFVSAAAERVQNGKADIRAEYARDPGYLMGGMRQTPERELSAYLYRPTGFHAPAGEVVSVTVDNALVDSGAHIRVGVHADNHSALASTSRFPKLSVDYRIDAATTEVVNPFGGNIYILIPQDMDLGWFEITIDDAVRAPYFSTRAGYETPPNEWFSIREYAGVTADFESDKFMISVPTAQIRSFGEPVELLNRWDEIMDIFQVLHGRPLERSRAEAYVLDATQLVVGSFPGGYPVTPGLYAEGQNGITDGYYSPFAALNEGDWEEDLGFLIMLHELGHHHYGRFILVGEQESYVNVPGAAVLQQLYGLSYDDALSFSGYQYFSRTDAAIDWMVTHNFRNGNPIGLDPTTDFEPIETSYQARGHAKYVDLAAIFGTWDVLGDIYRTYYEDDLLSGNPANTQVGVTHDDFLLRGSEALQCNLASLFHFWGIHPSGAVAAQIAAYPPCDGAAERIVHYLDNAPRTNAELVEFYEAKNAVEENQLKAHIYEPLLETFDVTEAQQIRDIGAMLLETYFNMPADTPPTAPSVSSTQLTIDPATASSVEFAWQASVDSENQPLTYTWAIYDATTGEELLSRTRVAGTSVSIPVAELSQAIGHDGTSEETISVTQRVTTSDTFTIVTSPTVATTVSFSSAPATTPTPTNPTTPTTPADPPSGGGGGGGAGDVLSLLALLTLLSTGTSWRQQRRRAGFSIV